MFATEPIIVRLPAKVVASASTFHISSGSAKRVIHFPATSTNGTLEKMLEPSTEDHVRFNPGTKQTKISTNTTQTMANKLQSSVGMACTSPSITASFKIFRNPARKIMKLIASPMIAGGKSAAENRENPMCEK